MTQAARSEYGSTLIEVLVSVVILGFGITAFLLNMTTTVGSSGISRQQADAEVVLTSVSEAIRDPNSYPYEQCATSYTVSAPLPNLPPGWGQVTAQVIGFWDPNNGVFEMSCGPEEVQTMQMIRITVTSPTGQVSWSREILKGPSL